MGPHQHVIIAGANKCGTTSLFRYLAAHPEVTGSVVKEAGFFNVAPAPGEAKAEGEYLSLFGPEPDRRRVLLEGTPTYLDGGLATARRIAETVNGARLIFLLREPADRLASYFRSKQGLKSAPSYGLTFEEFVTTGMEAEKLDPGQRSNRQEQLLHQWAKGRYAENLEAYLEVFDASDMLILFYDELRADARRVTQRAAEFSGIDPAFYGDFSFAVENRSRAHRNDSFRTWATHANHKLEPYLNRFPALRRAARAAYNMANASADRPLAPPAPVLATLRAAHGSHNARLAALLESRFGLSALPEWLGPESAGDGA
jgi:hypothetical protein